MPFSRVWHFWCSFFTSYHKTFFFPVASSLQKGSSLLWAWAGTNFFRPRFLCTPSWLDINTFSCFKSSDRVTSSNFILVLLCSKNSLQPLLPIYLNALTLLKIIIKTVSKPLLFTIISHIPIFCWDYSDTCIGGILKVLKLDLYTFISSNDIIYFNCIIYLKSGPKSLREIVNTK